MRRERFCLAAIAAMGVFVGAANAGISETIYGVTSTGFLARWQSDTPSILDSSVFIDGLQQNEKIVGIDFRPATGGLYGVGSTGRLYTINQATGFATQVGGTFATQINGSHFGYDFNPVIDRSRLVSNTDQNLVINPNDGTTTLTTDLFYAAGDPNFGADPNIVHNAYSNSFAGATSTVQYAMDSGLDVLVTLANNAGSLSTIGLLGIDIDAVGGFDISGATGIAYAALLESGSSATGFYTVNLATGAVTLIGEVDGGVVITAMTVQPIPVPGALALLGLAGLSSRSRRRR